MLTFGSYFVFDLPSAISQTLMDETGIDNAEYSQLYTAYTVSNFLSVILGGYILDRIGARFGAILFTCFICVGQILFGTGVQVKNYPLMIVGRCIYGLGGGSITVCQEAISTYYFSGKELGLAFSATLTVSRLGSVLNFFVSPYILKATGSAAATVWIGVSLCALSFVFVVIFYIMDKAHQKFSTGVMAHKDKKIDCKSHMCFRVEFWLLSAICATFYADIFPFISIASLMFEDGWSLDSAYASIITGIVYDVSLILSIPMGIVVDKVGNRMTLLWMATVLLVMSDVFLMVTFRDNGGSSSVQWVPIVAMILLGIAYTFVAAGLWSSISLVVRKAQVGSAMAIATAMQMAVNSIFQAMVGPIYEATGSYNADLIIFVTVALITLALVIVLMWYDRRHYQILNTASNVGIYGAEDLGTSLQAEKERLVNGDLNDTDIADA